MSFCTGNPSLFLLTWSTSAFFGATYTHLPDGLFCSSRRMANSAQTVFPLPVGAPTNTLSSELYRELNTAGCGGRHHAEWLCPVQVRLTALRVWAHPVSGLG